MGRYYNGTISGKFWFAIQSSDDASNFKPADYEPGPCNNCSVERIEKYKNIRIKRKEKEKKINNKNVLL